ncbi:hypothetical protein EDD18DRAFT_1102061 [Armillaria luteobubalina]|uniref:Uncharacterized protein n=1 Tax=Armillaria luteobubalina TaxID=153913 RepID=A0AA39QG92_9AGAR|nr:hypothetical protein EDD18DRAFT_1102061 [Armillaria luteobubalina]
MAEEKKQRSAIYKFRISALVKATSDEEASPLLVSAVLQALSNDIRWDENLAPKDSAKLARKWLSFLWHFNYQIQSVASHIDEHSIQSLVQDDDTQEEWVEDSDMPDLLRPKILALKPQVHGKAAFTGCRFAATIVYCPEIQVSVATTFTRLVLVIGSVCLLSLLIATVKATSYISSAIRKLPYSQSFLRYSGAQHRSIDASTCAFPVLKTCKISARQKPSEILGLKNTVIRLNFHIICELAQEILKARAQHYSWNIPSIVGRSDFGQISYVHRRRQHSERRRNVDLMPNSDRQPLISTVGNIGSPAIVLRPAFMRAVNTTFTSSPNREISASVSFGYDVTSPFRDSVLTSGFCLQWFAPASSDLDDTLFLLITLVKASFVGNEGGGWRIHLSNVRRFRTGGLDVTVWCKGPYPNHYARFDQQEIVGAQHPLPGSTRDNPASVLPRGTYIHPFIQGPPDRNATEYWTSLDKDPEDANDISSRAASSSGTMKRKSDSSDDESSSKVSHRTYDGQVVGYVRRALDPIDENGFTRNLTNDEQARIQCATGVMCSSGLPPHAPATLIDCDRLQLYQIREKRNWTRNIYLFNSTPFQIWEYIVHSPNLSVGIAGFHNKLVPSLQLEFHGST